MKDLFHVETTSLQLPRVYSAVLLFYLSIDRNLVKLERT